MNLYFSDFGATPDSLQNAQSAVRKMLHVLKQYDPETQITLHLQPGRYDFYPDESFSWNGGISNHSPNEAGGVCFFLSGRKNFTLDGAGAKLVFHGLCFPFALINMTRCVLKNFSVDFEQRLPLQLEIVSVAEDKSFLDVRPEKGGSYQIHDETLYSDILHFPSQKYVSYMTYEANGTMAYGMGDHAFRPEKVEKSGQGLLRIYMEANDLRAGQFLVLRVTARPNPVILLDQCTDIEAENITIHSSPGIGVMAQLSENITLRNIKVLRVRGETENRFYTLHGDATHFADCRGKVTVEECFFENMGDDGFNVHGNYLICAPAKNTGKKLSCHFGLPDNATSSWGRPGDKVIFLDPQTMRQEAGTYTIAVIERKLDEHGSGESIILEFMESLPELPENCGIANLSQMPDVFFRGNTIRCNRARGALFTTSGTVVCEDNFFDHVHGAAIMISGDCNGWFESGACQDVTIRHNRFYNPLTAIYEFCNAVINIEPVIKRLEDGVFFHRNIRILDNDFDYFDHPLLYALSVDGLQFCGNRIHRNQEFPEFHPNCQAITTTHCKNVQIGE